MATVDASWWDETVCNMMACQHPPCWETMWRIENGHPRILLRTLDSLRRQSPEYEEELPTLKIVDLPLNYSQRERIKGNRSLASLSKTISGIREARRILSNSTLNEALIPLTSVLSSEKNSFPGLNSRMESHTPHFASVNFSSWRPAEKIQVADLGEFAAHQMDFLPAYGNVVFRWIPNMRHRHLEPEKLTSRAAMSTQRMCVKELALEGILSCKDNQKVKTRKSNKVPTGGQPYLLHLKKRQQSPVSKPNPGGKDGHSKENSVRQGLPSPCQLHLAPVTPLSKEGAQALEDGSPTPESKEKFFPSLTMQKAPSRHTFGTKVPAKEKGPRRASSQLKLPFGGLGRARCRMPDRAEQPNRADTQVPDGQMQRAAMAAAASPQSAEDWSSLGPSAGPPPRRKRSVKFVEFKSNTASLYVGGRDGFIPRLSRTESKHTQYCQHLASRKEAAPLPQKEPPAISRDLWTQEAAKEPEEETLPQFLSPPGHPPPPPPSPLISESNGHPSP
ncbi:uncharacterized protein C9orf43 homolog isoform X1 [Pogona vitticeps]